MKTIKSKQVQSGDQGSKLPELAAEIKKQLGEAAGILKRSLGFYRKAGEALIEAKKELDPKRGRGGMAWANWLKTEIGIDKRVAQFYMRLARKWDNLKDHPDFRVDLHYAAALKLISKVSPKNNRHAVAGKIGPSQSAPPQDEVSTPALTTLATSLVQQEGQQDREQETAEDVPSASERHSLPRVCQETEPTKPVFNATAQVVGEADLVITPGEGYSLAQVMNLVAAGEAVIQEQNKTISKVNAEVIARFTPKLRDTWKLTNLTAIALAA